MIKRIYDDLDALLQPGKVLVIYGPRQVGKTTLLTGYLATTKARYKLDSGDNIRTQQVLGSQDFNKILGYVEGYDLLAIDEAQQVPHIGQGLKIIVDQRPDIKVIATGSSSFGLAHNLGEPLTGRKRTVVLYPVSQIEFSEVFNRFELKEKLEEFLVFGSYPEVVTSKTKAAKKRVLAELVDSYLLKDVLSLEKVKSPYIILNLLKLLAFQIGSQVSLNELATQLKIDVKTVDRYLDLLERSFVIHRLTGFSRNLRKEITKKNKYYFLDNGIRNGVISQFNLLDMRNDGGQLWENFIVTERLKKRAYKELHGSAHFWRTYNQQEIDLVEEREGSLFAYEIKQAFSKRAAAPADWTAAYPGAKFSLVDQDNYLEFVT